MTSLGTMQHILFKVKQAIKRCAMVSTLTILHLCIGTLSAQVSSLNSLAGSDDYGALRGMVSQTSLIEESDLVYAYRLHRSEKGFIAYFIGPNTFLIKSDLDIYNNIIYADFDNLGTIRPYAIENGRVDSLHLILNRGEAPIARYIYGAKEDQYGLLFHQGRYDLVEGIQFEFRKGSFNPAIDSAPLPDKVILKKTNYLVDSGVWYPIPKSKKDILSFILFHFKKKINKSRLKDQKVLDLIIDLNEI